MAQTEGATGGWNSAPQPPLTVHGKPINPWLVLASLMFGFFMSLLDATIVNVSLTNIQTDLKTDLTTVSWTLNAYNLTFAVLLVTMGRLADMFGRKRLFMLGMVMFSLGSLLCAVAPSIEVLIGFRAVQAIGSAALNPISLAVIMVVFPPHKRGAAIGVWGASAGLASAVGPVLGGFLVENFGWRSIFFVNLPFCIIGLFMVWRFMPESRDPRASRTIDIPGLIFITAGMFCLVLAIIEGNDWGWTSSGILLLFGGAAVSLVIFFFVELRQKQPIMDLALFRIRSFTAANISTFMFSVALQGAFLISVLYFINAQGQDQLGAAYSLLPVPIAGFIVSAVAGRLSAKINPRIMGITGLVLLAIGFFVLTTLSTDASYFDTAWRLVIIGLGMGMCFQTFPMMAVSEVPKPKLGVASGAFNTFRQIGFALGVAVLISFFAGQIKDNIATAQSNAVKLVREDTKLPEQVRNSIATNLQNAPVQQSQGRGEATGGNNQSQFDLTTLADRIPGGQALKPELASLNQRIGHEFKQAAVSAFTATWFVAGIVAVIGIFTAFFTHAPDFKAAGQQQERVIVAD